MAASQASQFARSYNSFSGVDIKAVFGSQVMAELQAISYSVTREKAPIYTMGSADPRSFSRGKRGIAGTLIFIMFDRHALLGAFGIDQPDRNLRLNFWADVDDIKPVDAPADKSIVSQALTGGGPGGIGATVEGQETPISAVDSDQMRAAPWFVDQIPPFDVTLAAANEYGALAVMRIYGLELLNEGYGVSIDDIVSETQFTYVARTLQGWRPVGFNDPNAPTE